MYPSLPAEVFSRRRVFMSPFLPLSLSPFLLFFSLSAPIILPQNFFENFRQKIKYSHNKPPSLSVFIERKFAAYDLIFYQFNLVKQ
jgi:hypothetical protein